MADAASAGRGLVIAIDGPSGAGKSTVSRLLADRLGYLQIDTGAMYRAVAFMMHRAGVDPDDAVSVSGFCSSVDVRLESVDGVQRVIANGQDVTGMIRTPEMSLMTSRVSALAPVRDAMVLAQRRMGSVGGVVLEGRDIGTVVFPDADIKFFLSASAEERGKRRFLELQAKGEKVTLRETIDSVARRDLQDSQRDIAPLKMAEDAIAVDSSGMDVVQVLDIMESICLKKLNKAGRQP